MPDVSPRRHRGDLRSIQGDPMSENAEASTSTPGLMSRENVTTLILSLVIVGLAAVVLLPRIAQEEISVLSWRAILGAAAILVALVLQLTIWRPDHYTTFLVRALTMIIILVALMFFEPIADLMQTPTPPICGE